MTPFCELYSKYYTLTSHLLTLATEQPVSLDEVRQLVTDEGFLESPLYFLPAVLSQDEEGYHLLHQEKINDKSCYTSILKNKPLPFLTELECRWLKSLLEDDKLQLFLNDEDYYLLKKALHTTQPLITADMLSYARQQEHSSKPLSDTFSHCFKALLQALENETLISLSFDEDYKASSEIALEGTLFVPYKIEYALLNDTFSLLAITMEDNTPHKLLRLPLAHITDVTCQQPAPKRTVLDKFVKSCKCQTPLHFEIHDMRSGFERAFMYLSPYERVTQFNEEKNTCLVQLYYYPFDEAQLIDILLSFGPIIKVLGPSHIRALFKARIEKQYDLFANFFS